MRTEEKIIENYTDIPALLKNCGARRPFLCCGKSFEKTGAKDFKGTLRQLLSALSQYKLSLIVV